jgi:hypothetical protein
MGRVLAAALVALVLSVPGVVVAAKSSPTVSGAIVVDQSDVSYGDTVTFTVSSSPLDRWSSLYTSVVCVADGRVVYQSMLPAGASFELVDQTGDNLHWNGEAAVCHGQLVVRTIKGRSDSLTWIADTVFDVGGV